MRRINTIGLRYGRLTSLKEVDPKILCRCDCGVEKLILRTSILAGYVKSCGCLQRERTAEANTTHGHRKNDLEISGTYRSWRAMKARCDNVMKDHFENYGGRGITYISRWSQFENFLEDMGERPEGLELDRIDNNLGYSKENCRWTTHKINCNNRGY